MAKPKSRKTNKSRKIGLHCKRVCVRFNLNLMSMTMIELNEKKTLKICRFEMRKKCVCVTRMFLIDIICGLHDKQFAFLLKCYYNIIKLSSYMQRSAINDVTAMQGRGQYFGDLTRFVAKKRRVWKKLRDFIYRRRLGVVYK